MWLANMAGSGYCPSLYGRDPLIREGSVKEICQHMISQLAAREDAIMENIRREAKERWTGIKENEHVDSMGGMKLPLLWAKK